MALQPEFCYHRIFFVLFRFRTELKEISAKIKERNKTMTVPYSYLDPEEVPNAISI